jgi:hypothetical protein
MRTGIYNQEGGNMASTMQPSTILNRANPESDPFILLAALKNEAGLTDEQSRDMLKDHGFDLPSVIIDPRFDCVDRRRCRGGFAA